VSQYWKSLIYFGKGEQISEIVNVWKKYTELIVTRASGSIPVDFLCQNGFGVSRLQQDWCRRKLLST
jgi:hypothetical protein